MEAKITIKVKDNDIKKIEYNLVKAINEIINKRAKKKKELDLPEEFYDSQYIDMYNFKDTKDENN
jgi:uncharacterized protein (DUF2252 family)